MIASRWPARTGLILLTAASVALVAGPARADISGDVAAGTSKVTFTAAYGVKNTVVITRSGRTVTIDDRVAITPGKGCKRVKGDKTKVRCKTKKTPAQVVVKVYDRNDSVVNNSDLKLVAHGGDGADKLVGGPKGDVFYGDDPCDRVNAGNDKIYGRGGNDTIVAGDGADYVSAGDGDDSVNSEGECVNGPDRSGNDVVYGGNGRDLVSAGPGDDQVYGGNGDDFLYGSVGRDRIEGGAGNDELYGDEGSSTAAADVLLGGSGRDLVVYYGYTKPVTVDLDGASRDDGIAGEHDTVGADVEGIYGGSGNDRLTGNAAANEIHGWDGADVILGGGGADRLLGWNGANQVYGEAGDDDISASNLTGVSVLDGGSGADVCSGHAEASNTLVSCEEERRW